MSDRDRLDRNKRDVVNHLLDSAPREVIAFAVDIVTELAARFAVQSNKKNPGSYNIHTPVPFLEWVTENIDKDNSDLRDLFEKGLVERTKDMEPATFRVCMMGIYLDEMRQMAEDYVEIMDDKQPGTHKAFTVVGANNEEMKFFDDLMGMIREVRGDENEDT